MKNPFKMTEFRDRSYGAITRYRYGMIIRELVIHQNGKKTKTLKFRLNTKYLWLWLVFENKQGTHVHSLTWRMGKREGTGA